MVDDLAALRHLWFGEGELEVPVSDVAVATSVLLQPVLLELAFGQHQDHLQGDAIHYPREQRNRHGACSWFHPCTAACDNGMDATNTQTHHEQKDKHHHDGSTHSCETRDMQYPNTCNAADLGDVLFLQDVQRDTVSSHEDVPEDSVSPTHVHRSHNKTRILFQLRTLNSYIRNSSDANAAESRSKTLSFEFPFSLAFPFSLPPPPPP